MSEFSRRFESFARAGLQGAFERARSLDTRWGVSERLDRLREDLSQTQRLLADGSQIGGFEQMRNLRVWYARLEVEYGADADAVTRSYRRLVKLYHPDLYAGTPHHEALATEVTQDLVTAYNGLLRHLNGR